MLAVAGWCWLVVLFVLMWFEWPALIGSHTLKMENRWGMRGLFTKRKEDKKRS